MKDQDNENPVAPSSNIVTKGPTDTKLAIVQKE